jgi:hypothetical protein
MTSQELRTFVKAALEFAADIVKLSSTEVDDKVVAVLARLADSDAGWALLEKLIGRYLDDSQLVESDGTDLVSAVAGEVGVDPATVLQIVMLVVQFIRALRK